MATRNLSVMFTDIKGFTERTSDETRRGVADLLEEHQRLLIPVFDYFDGTVAKTIGDAFLVYFESPTDAVLCGVTIQEVLRRHNANKKERDRLEIRVAINVGEVELKGNDVHGEAVNIAARLEGVTEAGEVWFTDAVYQTMNRKEAPSAEVGERIFKGIPYPVRVYRVIQDPNSSLAQVLASGIELTDQGPRLKGIRERVNGGPKGIPSWVKWGGAAALGAAALFIALRPSAAQRDVEAAVVEVMGSPELRDMYFPDPLEALLARYPEDPEVPFAAGNRLEEEGHPITVLWLYGEALQRGGYAGDDQIFGYAVASLTTGAIDHQKYEAAELLLLEHFPHRSLEWARDGLNTHDVQTFGRAWHYLGEVGDPLRDNPYYHALSELVSGGEVEMGPLLETFLAQDGPQRRDQILALHREFVETFPRFTAYGRKRDQAQANLERLLQAWNRND
jgi:class 3 adenylate cyclase